MKKIKALLYHLFVPNEENNYKAKALHHDFLTFYLIIAFVLAFSFKKISPHLTNILGFATDITVNKLYQLTNQERQKNNISTLTYNEKLSQAAYKKAQDMFRKNYWSHYAPDGATPWDFILASDYQYEFAGENLAKNFLFSQGVLNAWMDSKTHKDNILRGDYTEVGFAVVNGVLNGEETTLVVQMFGKPLEKPLTQIKSQLPTEKNTLVKNESITKNNNQAVLAKQSYQKGIEFNNFSVDFLYVFIFFLLAVLVTDFYFASKMNIVRISGKNIGHFVFLGFIFVGLLLFFTRGAII